MSLIENIDKDLKQAMKEKNELLILVLRTINSEIHNKEIEEARRKRKAQAGGPATIPPEADLGGKLTDEEVIEVIASEAKKRKEAIEEFKKGERNDLAEKEQKELEILNKYLPEQMNEEQIREEAKKAIEEVGATGAQDIGKVMSVLMAKLKGKAEGGTVSKIVNDLLRS